MAQVIIVNHNDKLVGYKKRDDLTKNEIHRVSALWLENSKGEILLAQRSFNKKINPGRWGPAAAGHVEKGETYLSNIKKEAFEEIGIKNLKLKKSYKFYFERITNYFVQFYTARIDLPETSFKIQKEEVERVKWFSKKELVFLVKKNPEKFVKSVPILVEKMKLD